ncbi:MAG: hypothetical protein ACLUKN_08100 [Bacilli bacterium]
MPVHVRRRLVDPSTGEYMGKQRDWNDIFTRSHRAGDFTGRYIEIPKPFAKL